MTLPRISIVMPSYNQGAYLEASICSILDQGYDNLEFIIVDGGSADNSRDIIEKYERHLTYWVSERDRGQSHAINKGFGRATGEVLNWLCSDDTLTPGALREVGQQFAGDPQLDVLVGGCEEVFPDRPECNSIHRVTPADFATLPLRNPIPQPSCFYRKRTLDRSGPIDESYHYVMDLELWTYFLSRNRKWKLIDAVLSQATASGQNKTMTGGTRIVEELDRLYRSYSDESIPMTAWINKICLPLACFERRNRGNLRGRIGGFSLQRIASLLGSIYGRERFRMKLDQHIAYGCQHVKIVNQSPT